MLKLTEACRAALRSFFHTHRAGRRARTGASKATRSFLFMILTATVTAQFWTAPPASAQPRQIFNTFDLTASANYVLVGDSATLTATLQPRCRPDSLLHRDLRPDHRPARPVGVRLRHSLCRIGPDHPELPHRVAHLHCLPRRVRHDGFSVGHCGDLEPMDGSVHRATPLVHRRIDPTHVHVGRL